MIYLASPYSHKDPRVERQRFLVAESFVTHVIKTRNLVIFSPIVYCHKLATDNSLPTDYHYYLNFNMNVLRRSESLFLLKLPGWEESTGVDLELKVAKMLLIPVVEWSAEFECETEQ